MGRRSFPDEFLIRRASPRPAAVFGDPVSASLAHRPDLRLGTARVSPSTRTLAGSDSSVIVEPRVMQVLLLLADVQGAVVTRAELIEHCWNGQIVGDDSINRAISELRRALRAAGADLTVETIPKIGYRLSIPETPEGPSAGPAARLWSRRALIVGGVAAATGAAGLYGWHRAAASDPRIESLLARARAALRDELPEATHHGVELLREATRLAPDDAKAWGLLAIALRDTLDFVPAGQIAAMVSSSEQAIARALAIDPNQAEALAAQALLPPIFGDWTGAEKRLNAVLARYPDQPDALEGLGVLLMSTGRIRDAAGISARLARNDPLSPVNQFRDAYRQWSLGDLGGADRTIDRALQLWPRHPAVCYARFLIFALSGRAEAAQRMLRPDAGAPIPVAGFALDGWSKALAAMRSGAVPDRIAAITANLALARTGIPGCTNAVLALTGIGALDAAFDVANGFLLHQGPLAGAIDLGPGVGAFNDQRWRKTIILFIAGTAPLRADARFARLCAGMGLTDYWKAARVQPDYLRKT